MLISIQVTSNLCHYSNIHNADNMLYIYIIWYFGKLAKTGPDISESMPSLNKCCLPNACNVKPLPELSELMRVKLTITGFGDGLVNWSHGEHVSVCNSWNFIIFSTSAKPSDTEDDKRHLSGYVAGILVHIQDLNLVILAAAYVLAAGVLYQVTAKLNILHHMSWRHGAWGPISWMIFSIAIQIWWKFHSALIQIIVKWSLWNLAHGTEDVLLWHVQNFVAIWYHTMELD